MHSQHHSVLYVIGVMGIFSNDAHANHKPKLYLPFTEFFPVSAYFDADPAKGNTQIASCDLSQQCCKWDNGLINSCGGSTYDGHEGIDFDVPNPGQPGYYPVKVYSGAAGVVTYFQIGQKNEPGCPKCYGNYVMIDLGNEWTIIYAHLESVSPSLYQGKSVVVGEYLGIAGNTGFSTGHHLHMEVRHNGVAIDPFAYTHRDIWCGGEPSLLDSKGCSAESVVYHSPGTLLKMVNDPKVYLVMGDGKTISHLANETVFNALHYVWDDIINVFKDEIECMLKGDPITSVPLFGFFKSTSLFGAETLWFYWGSPLDPQRFRRKVFEYSWNAVLQSYGMSMDDVEVSNAKLSKYPESEGHQYSRNGTLIQIAGTQEVYIVDNALARKFESNAVFKAAGYKSGKVHVVSADEFNGMVYDIGAPMTQKILSQCLTNPSFSLSIAGDDPLADTCVGKLMGSACDDGNLCTKNEICNADGVCVGIPMTCYDSNPCTQDSCDEGVGCVNVPTTGACDDSNTCTANDACVENVCTGMQAVCDDNNFCTFDTCTPEVGCVFQPVMIACEDGDFCTKNDLCIEGICTSGADECGCKKHSDCIDENVCTYDVCDQGMCTYSYATGSCEDGDLCTANDVCTFGVCASGLNTCECTADAHCLDDNSCTTDMCVNKKCMHVSEQIACESDNNVCTLDTCQNGVCTHSAQNISCNDNNVCTQNDVCTSGSCKGLFVLCNDANPCTSDSCDPVQGCVYAKNAACDISDVTPENSEAYISWHDPQMSLIESASLYGCVGYDWEGELPTTDAGCDYINLFDCGAADVSVFKCPVPHLTGKTIWFDIDHAPTSATNFKATDICHADGSIDGKLELVAPQGFASNIVCMQDPEDQENGIMKITINGDLSVEDGGFLCNGSFEQGAGCWERRVLQSDNFAFVVHDCSEATDAYDGECAVRVKVMQNAVDTYGVEISTRVQLALFNTYTLRFWAKSESDPSGVNVMLGYENDEYMPFDWYPIFISSGDVWKEYTVPLTQLVDLEYSKLTLNFTAKGTLMIDRVSLKSN